MPSRYNRMVALRGLSLQRRPLASAGTFLEVWPDDEEMQKFSYVWDGKAWWVSNGKNDELTLLLDALAATDPGFTGQNAGGPPRVISPKGLEHGDAPAPAVEKPANSNANPLWGAFA